VHVQALATVLAKGGGNNEPGWLASACAADVRAMLAYAASYWSLWFECFSGLGVRYVRLSTCGEKSMAKTVRCAYTLHAYVTVVVGDADGDEVVWTSLSSLERVDIDALLPDVHVYALALAVRLLLAIKHMLSLTDLNQHSFYRCANKKCLLQQVSAF
jgi:hypothetical protein